MTDSVSAAPPSAPNSAPTRFLNGWRIAGWGMAAALLLIPAVAMRFTSEVNWTTSDFVFAAVLLGALGLGVEIALRVGRTWLHRVGIALMALTGFMTVWSDVAVGLLGDEDEITNLAFVALVGVGVLATLLVRFRPGAMRWIAATLSAGQFAIGIVAGLWTMPGHAIEWGVLAFFAALWAAAAFCFDAASRRGSGRAAR